MKVVVFGSTRGVGRLVVQQAVDAGYSVRAFARDPAPLVGLPVEVVRGDVLQPEIVRSAVAGMDAVISSLGQGSSNAPTVHLSEGTAAILGAMSEHGVRRGLFVTSLGAATDDPNEPFLFRHVGRRLYGNIFADHARVEAKVRASDTDWTLIRPAALTDRPRTGTYRVSRDHRPPGARSISRADVAEFVLAELVARRHVRAAVALGD